MENIIEILSYVDDLLFVIRDLDGKIIFPKDKETLKNIETILKSQTIIDNEYYYKEKEAWFEFSNRQIIYDGKEYILEFFKNITKYKKREHNLAIDETTNLYNKKLTYRLINEYIVDAINSKDPFSILIADIDFFKKINDVYGHLCGDMVLAKIGIILLENTRQKNGRKNDVVGRIGGEEFLILIKDCSNDCVLERAENIKKIIESTIFEYEGKPINQITMSFGIHHISNQELNSITDIDDFRSSIIRKCDKALYQSKKNGRNMVTEFID